MQPLTYFLHIPKTAGTSFSKFLLRTVGNDKNYWDIEWDPQISLKEKTLSVSWKDYSLFMGHFTNVVTEYLPSDTSVITMLRNPLERTISHFHHLMNDPYVIRYYKGEIWTNVGDGNLVVALEKNDMMRYGMSDMQTKYLGITDGYRQAYLNYGDIKFDEFLPEIYSKTDMDWLLENAKKRLTEIAFFGLQEYYEQSLLLFHLTFDIPYQVADVDRLMVLPTLRAQKENLEVPLRDMYEHMNRYDTELYSFGRKEFEKRYAESLSRLAKSLIAPIPHISDIEAAKKLLLKKAKLSRYLPINRTAFLIAGKIARKFKAAVWHA